MATDTAPSKRFSQAGKKLIQPTIRFAIIFGLLGIFLYGLPRLPGTDRVVYEPATIATLLHSVITILIFGLILNYATTIGSVLADVFNFKEIERIIQLVGLFIVIVWAYQVFWWLPYFEANPDQYDLLFLILGLGVAGWLGFILYTNADQVSQLFTKKLVTDESITTSNKITTTEQSVSNSEPSQKESGAGQTEVVTSQRSSEQTSTTSKEQESKTSKTSKQPESMANEMSTSSDDELDEIMADLVNDSENDDDTIYCTNCGTSLPNDAQFCHSCGTELIE